MFDSRRMALLSALVLAVMQWHLIYSRTAFNAVSWPLLEMITVLCLFLALKLRNPWWFASAGLALGLGIYTTNVYPVFIVGIVIFVALQMLQARPSRRGVMDHGHRDHGRLHADRNAADDSATPTTTATRLAASTTASP
jgi:asparagine N-glycosylation enzyme membrane subunit Stt3